MIADSCFRNDSTVCHRQIDYGSWLGSDGQLFIGILRYSGQERLIRTHYAGFINSGLLMCVIVMIVVEAQYL